MNQNPAIDYQQQRFAWTPCAEQQSPGHAPVHPVVIIGAGPVGLACAIDLARQGIAVVLVDDDDTLSTGSRAICFAKRTLDIFDRIGCGQRMVDKGVGWNRGKVFLRDQAVYEFDLLPESGHARPAFINLQQYYVEGYLLEQAQQWPHIEIRWKNKVSAIAHHEDHEALTVDTPQGSYTLKARYVVAADGSRSPLRKMMGLESQGHTFRDRFLIADVKMDAPFPAERWFWFDPPFHPQQSVLLHRQPDDVWRIDFQLGWDADPVLEKTPERVIPRVRALLGEEVSFSLEWVSVYTFSCVRMERFRHGRVLFVGDAAHCVSPFGARGANSGIQDAENLAWKLAHVLQGKAPDSLLDSYASEREYAADENLLNSTRSTDFITPKSAVSRAFRDAVLGLAREHAFARRLVNSGRLSLPATLDQSPLNTPDQAAAPEAVAFTGPMRPGAPCCDAPLLQAGQPAWLLPQLGDRFVLMIFAAPAQLPAATRQALAALAQPDALRLLFISAQAATQEDERVLQTLAGQAIQVQDIDTLAAQRYDAHPGSCYLIRPDQHVSARWRSADAAAVAQALLRATGHATHTTNTTNAAQALAA
ncbi:FAD-dependent oxidoreductase [Herbaspirillum seropedicae]|uniref:2-polyprenyl-6-methoxyphenol hydroxylase protein n=1 Tax=Herbaspirillum seropedicae (strain SmR1) TaxID=757424 RepID=D8IYA2_HERSS|nr:FAD-dependent oxidoreductase [Herbaspirillum seropedicae]ADJ62062.1 2-polyprenyl-6-methoxyphenol hydroxylase protein [Herbaspirillum seropedicae SmR1]AKN64235.1 FAD-dependent oxidoreductase [Herbaspirillum seropedicae]NQE27895.1 FAD-dependent oxidoreductase [Herbaspirillum seropedicae]UMU20151.1 FAD-dependent oxidoreductase [Herbaspirillum seropedicae]